METQAFASLLAQLALLTSRQCTQLQVRLGQADARQHVGRLLDQAAQEKLCCPRCAGTRWYRHGRESGLQRYRCRTCGKTFNTLTGTPLARLHYKERWLAYLDGMLASHSLRHAASRLGVHRNTTFRWRHRFLALPRTDRAPLLHGIAEADEMFLLESQKGSRHLDRPPRRRGGHARRRGISHEQVCILVARDRNGRTLDFVTGCGALTRTALHQCLRPALDPDILLVTDANAAYRAFARESGITHEAVNLRAGARTRGALHLQNVNAYHSRFRAWLHRFHGVATRYLPNYLGWRCILDAHRIDTPECLLKAAIGHFPRFAGT
ncbi:IS1595 family transposase [Duganella sp. FT92W]|uniref:IS1595 family transposase n=1 Tax=Pseudoduganella rivuli TaxID=2666085 RepID=A0A7X2LTL7_9BURK|nr:IS1595 family transposase [Pseudoduganella rivuli]MRV71984.1 IS1595 family transposase [Pseudoduganella rivuli]